MVSQRRLELTKSWQGNNTFLFGGRWMLGPDNKALTATVLLLSAPTALFLGMVGVDLGNRLSWAFEAIVALACVPAQPPQRLLLLYPPPPPPPSSSPVRLLTHCSPIQSVIRA